MTAITELTKAIAEVAEAIEPLIKSHVKTYTRQDGTVVKEHDDSRQKKTKLPSHWMDAHDHAVDASYQAWNFGGSHHDAVKALQHSKKLHKQAAEAARADGDTEAAKHHDEKAHKHSSMIVQHKNQILADEAEQRKPVKTNNEGYGYHGEAWRPAREHGYGEKTDEVAADHFNTAAKAVMKHGGASAIDARNYLDSVHGRHLHDEVQNRTTRHEGMPKDADKGHHPDAIKKHIDAAVKEHFGRKYAQKNLAKVKANRAAFE